MVGEGWGWSDHLTSPQIVKFDWFYSKILWFLTILWFLMNVILRVYHARNSPDLFCWSKIRGNPISWLFGGHRIDGFVLSHPYIEGLRTRLINICLVTDVWLISSLVLNDYLEWMQKVYQTQMEDLNYYCLLNSWYLRYTLKKNTGLFGNFSKHGGGSS